MALLNYTQQKKVGRVVFHIVVVFLCFLMTYPLLYMLFSSFKTAQDIFQHPNSLFPQEWCFDNYPTVGEVSAGVTFTTFFGNSLFVTILAVFGAGCLLLIGGLRFCSLQF